MAGECGGLAGAEAEDVSGEGFVGCGLAVLLLAFAAFLVVVTLGAAGCIESEAFRNQRTVIIVDDPAEIEKVLKNAR